MPYVNVKITGGATAAQKRAVHKGITDVLVNVLGKNPEYTFVVIEEVSDENWGHKGTSVAELKAAAKKPGVTRVAATAKASPKKAAVRKA